MPIEKSKKQLKITSTVLEDIFIEDFMLNATELQLKVYILGLRHIKDSNSFDISLLAKLLNVEKKDVYNAYQYWEERGIIKISKKSSDDPKIEYLSIIEQYISENFVQKDYNDIVNKSNIEMMIDKLSEFLSPFPLIRQERIQVAKFLNDYEVNQELLIEAFELSKESQHRVNAALNKLDTWNKNSLKTIEEVKDFMEKFNLRNKQYREILSAIGKPYSLPSIGEKQIIDKWLDVYKYDMDYIIDNIAYATKKNSKVNMNYLDKIITSDNKYDKQEYDYDEDDIFEAF